MAIKFLRREEVAARYGVKTRTVDRWKLDGRLPRPHLRGVIPLWREDQLEELDRKATVSANSGSQNDR